jgi:hypothetical protein
VFAEKGHIAVGLEGALHFAAMARAHSGCGVWQLDLPEKYFDGVLANAALFHVPARNCRECGRTDRKSLNKRQPHSLRG